jgi:hypothetical protein
MGTIAAIMAADRFKTTIFFFFFLIWAWQNYFMMPFGFLHKGLKELLLLLPIS